MADRFSITLLKLECLVAQEIDGDEIYLKAGDRVIWRSEPDKMHYHPDLPGQVAEFDFAEGRKRTQDGWQPMKGYDPATFTLTNCEGTVLIQIWDADTLTSDDLLGETPIDASQADNDLITIVFQRDGGNYLLTYRVEAAL